MYLIKYKGGELGCPSGSIYGELVGYNWNSNDYSDERFPKPPTVLNFLTDYEVFEPDFFYFGSEFICSEKMLKIITQFEHGAIDIVEVSVFLKAKGAKVKSDNKYALIRSREIRSLLDADNSSFELRIDPRTGAIEQDSYHEGRYIYDLISDFKLKKSVQSLDFFICSELLMEEYVFSPELKQAIECSNMKGFKFSYIEDIVYDARLDF
ncbi:hypothetical protein N5D61_02400 [Pseudomonas sp. GD03842]|uniref:Imm43 family immunity protein n=1 Tax=Pseudomonas sp. GD03842 TaxID=2975385 RepID=UPI0024468454|nr:hypothetical protein [Pseudomonas sp. GD03842]MDH0745195.1 hypothetical protein [Pseudomonas sp. GD03842]